MAVLTTITNGEYSIHFDGVTYTRSTTAPLHIIEKTGDDDRIVNFTFTVPGVLSGTITSVTLNFQIASLVAGTGAIPLRVSSGSATSDPDNEELFTAIHVPSPTAWADPITDSVGAKAVPLNAVALAEIQGFINEPSTSSFGVALDFAPGASSYEEITLASSPTLTLTFEGDEEDEEEETPFIPPRGRRLRGSRALHEFKIAGIPRLL